MSEEEKIELVAPKETLNDMDKMILDLAKSKRQTALALAEKALAQNETAEISYKYIILQIYMKYGLTEADAINENGEIMRGAAHEVRQGK